MTEKLDYYDLLGILVPGILLQCWVAITFPAVQGIISTVKLSEALSVIAFTAAAIFIGQLLQAIGSIAEPLMFLSWGGNPSDQALSRGLGRYFPEDSASRVRQVLASHVGSDATHRSLFLFAMQAAESAVVSRTGRFNAIYAYHRALCILATFAILLLASSALWGAAREWSYLQLGTVFVSLLLLLFLLWHRTKQRAFYYVREVLLTAERLLDKVSGARNISYKAGSS